MAKIKKRQDGRVQKSIRINGRRYYAYGNTAAEAEYNLHKKIDKVENRIEIHDNPTLNQYYERWTITRRGAIKESTLHSQVSQYKAMACVKSSITGQIIGDMSLKEINVDDIRDIQRELLNGGRKTQSVNDCIAHLSHVFNSAIKERRIEFNPCCPVEPLKRIEERARDTHHRALSNEETKAFFEAAKGSYYYTVYRMAIHTGMRVGEIGALLPKDIRVGMINVEKTITRLESGAYAIGESAKTESGRRQIPLNNAIREVLEDQKEINNIMDGGKITTITTPIFRAPEGGLLMSTPVNREIKKICKAAGIEYFTMHALRATFATRCIEQGINPRTVQEILGHKDFALTMNLYGHVLTDTKKEAMENLIIAI